MLYPITIYFFLFSIMCVQQRQINYECKTKQFCKKQNCFIIHVKQKVSKLCNKYNKLLRMAIELMKGWTGKTKRIVWRQETNIRHVFKRTKQIMKKYYAFLILLNIRGWIIGKWFFDARSKNAMRRFCFQIRDCKVFNTDIWK